LEGKPLLVALVTIFCVACIGRICVSVDSVHGHATYQFLFAAVMAMHDACKINRHLYFFDWEELI